MLVTDRGQTLRTKVSEIRETGRNAQGVRVMTVEEGERVVAIEALAESEDTIGLSMAPDGSSLPPDGSPTDGTPGDTTPTDSTPSDDVN
jgi:DNA gyrase subunit A